METTMVTCGSCGNQMPANMWSCPNCGDLNPDAEAEEFLYLGGELGSNKPYFSTPMEPGPFSTPMSPWGFGAEGAVIGKDSDNPAEDADSVSRLNEK